MKRRITLQPVSGKPISLTLEVGRHGEFSLEGDDVALQGQHQAVSPHSGVLRLAHREVPFHSARVGGELHLWLDGCVYRFSLESDNEGSHTASRPGAAAGGTVTAPMPGRVVQVNAQPGASVAAGDVLVVVESMKVQFNVAAPSSGTVAEVCCEPGQMVELGAVLARLEPVR